MKRAYHNLYYRGMEARENGKPREAVPALLDGIEKGWWLAGWHDMDIEMKESKRYDNAENS